MTYRVLAAAAVAIAAGGAATAGTISYISGATGFTGSVDITEVDNGNGTFFYVVENNTNGRLVEFGVTNTNTEAFIINPGDDFGCYGDANMNWCYQADSLSESEFDSLFANDYGSFDSIADSGENTINMFFAVDGDIGPGESDDDFFGFSGLAPASNIIVGLSGANGFAYFTAGSAVVGGGSTGGGSTGGGANVVPLPAAGWMLLGGIAGLGAIRSRKKA